MSPDADNLSAPLAQRTVVAAFDFDGTLTDGDTLIPFLCKSLGWRKFFWVLLLSAPWLIAYFLRLINNEQAKARLLQHSVAGWRMQHAKRVAEDFVTQYLPLHWRAGTLQQLTDHQQRGHRCVLISASPDIYMQAVARALRVDALICTRMAVHDGRLTGEMATPNCYGPQKAIRLRQWCQTTLGADQAIELHAYGDSAGDRELLEMADHAWFRGRKRD